MGIFGIKEIIFGIAMSLGMCCIPMEFGGGQVRAGLPVVMYGGQDASDVDLVIEVKDGFADVRLWNAEEYRAFILWLKGPHGKSVTHLTLDLGGTDVCLYVDEILNGNSLRGLTIRNGGEVSIKDRHILEKYSLASLCLYHIFSLEEDVVSGIQGLDYIVVRLDDRYRSAMPTGELLKNRECGNVVLLWEGGTGEGLVRKGEPPFGGVKGKDILLSELEKESVHLNGIYRQNEDGYTYTSYEFFRGNEVAEVFLGVEEGKSSTEGFYEMLRIPQERLGDISEQEGYRFLPMDVNFDGYVDLVFLGDTDAGFRYQQCVVYLWEEDAGKFAYCETAPRSFQAADAKRKRLTDTYTGGIHEEDYYIYEYESTGGVFVEKHMEVRYTDYGDVIWGLYGEGELQERLYLSGKGGERHYVYQGRDGEMEVEKVPDGMEFDEIGKKFFPEFDFYFFG